MYKRAMKIARVLDGTDRENMAINLGKRKFEYNKQGPKGGNPKSLNTSGPRIGGATHFLAEENSL